MTYRVLHMSRIFSVHVQVRELDRSLSFYRNALGLQADRNDGTLAMLRGRGDSGHTLVIRRIGDHAARHSLGEVGVSRLAVRMTGSTDLDRAEELLTRHQVPYRRHHVVNAGYLTGDPTGCASSCSTPTRHLCSPRHRQRCSSHLRGHQRESFPERSR